MMPGIIIKSTFFNRKSGFLDRKSVFLDRKSGFFRWKPTCDNLRHAHRQRWHLRAGEEPVRIICGVVHPRVAELHPEERRQEKEQPGEYTAHRDINEACGLRADPDNSLWYLLALTSYLIQKFIILNARIHQFQCNFNFNAISMQIATAIVPP